MSAQTLAGVAHHEIEIKHSRFLAIASPVDTPEAALVWLTGVGDRAATHNCWAYRIGDLYRSSDDGEVAGTAGRPILSAIDGQGLDQAVVLVTRWYGGTRLGVGGLVRAYGGCAAECLRTAARRAIVEYQELRLRYPFEHTGAVHAALAQHGADKLDEQFDATGASLLLRIPAGRSDALMIQLRDASRDQVEVETTPDPSAPAA